MKINNVGYNFIHQKDFLVNRPSGTGDLLFLIIKSNAFATSEGRRIDIEPNSVFIYKKDSPQLYGSRGENYVNDWFHFDADDDDLKKLEKFGIPFEVPINIGDISSLSMLIKSMHCEKYSNNPYKDDAMILYANLIFIKLAEKLSRSSKTLKSRYFKEMSDLRSRIYSEPNSAWTIEKMAESVSLSRSYFQHLYRDLFGVGAISDLINSRIEHAQFLLLSTDEPISTISELCGYRSEVHFMRQFKKLRGLTPSEYRKTSSQVYKRGDTKK